MRILYCSEKYSPHDHRFLSALAETDHDVFWFSLLGANNIQEKRDLPPSIHIVEWEIEETIIAWLDYIKLKEKFRAVVEKVQPDIIHAGPIQRVAFLPALLNFHPLLSMSWGFDLLEDADRNWFWKMVTRYVLKQSDWLIADCQTVKGTAIDFGFPAEDVTVFPWGVDLSLFSPGKKTIQRRKIGFEDDLLIIHTRSWEPRYGVNIALRGFQKAAQLNSKIKMIMLGGGSQEKDIRQFIETHDLSQQVFFYGYQKNEDLASFYKAADLYLSASHVDGSSVALMEAMACGCPGLVSDIPSNLEWISDGVHGLTFQDGNADDLARQINAAANQRKELAPFGKAARQKAELMANWEKSVEKLLAAYQQLVEKDHFSKNSGGH